MATIIRHSIDVSAQTGFCEGHFPGHPIVPGAVQLMWLVSLAQDHGLCHGGYTVTNLKLLRELPPGIRVELSLQADDGAWLGKIADAGGAVFAQCRLQFPEESARA